MQFMWLLIRFAVCLVLVAAPVNSQSDDLAAKSKRGKDLMAGGKFEEAIPIYRDLVRALPNNPGPLMDLGLALHMAGHDQEALTQFRAVLKLQPHHLPARLFLGATYLGLKQPAEALGPLKTYVRLQPQDKDARLLLGEALLALRRFKDAANVFEKLSEMDPQNPKAWNGLGLSYEGLANRDFKELEEIAPGSAYWLILVAESRIKADQPQRAFYFYREALKQTPTLRGVHVALAEIYKKAGHADWAAVEEQKERAVPPLACDGQGPQSASRAARKDPATRSLWDPRVSKERLECDFRAGRYQELAAATKDARTAEALFWRTRAFNELAKQAFERLAQLPPSAEVYELLARIHSDQKNYSAAAGDWQEAMKLAPGNPYYQREFAMALSAAGDHEHAQPLLEDLVKQSPDSPELNYWLGFALLSQEKPAAAVPFLDRAVKGEPDVLEAQRDLARAYLRVGEMEKAIPHLKAALPIDEDGSLYYQLAQAYRRTGQTDLEKELLRRFREIQGSAIVEKKKLEQQFQITPP
jgi:predicted Zn-dependent protease